MTGAFAAILLAIAIGFALALLVDRRAEGTLLFGEAILLGIAALAAILYIESLAGVSWTRMRLLAGVAVVFVIVWPAAIRARRTPDEIATVRSRFSLLFDAVTIAALTGYAIFATIGPLWEFDYIGDFGLKGRAFFEHGGIDWGVLEHPSHSAIHPDYPPLLPLAMNVAAVLQRGWSERAPGMLNVAWAVGLLLLIRRLAAEETRSQTAAAFIALAVLPFAACPWIGIAEGPLVAYAIAGLLLIRKGSVMPGAVMLGIAASTKNEGISFIVAVAFGLLLARRYRDVVKLWPAVVIALPWMLLRAVHRLPTDIAEGSIVTRVLAHLRDPLPLLQAFVRYPVGKHLFWLGLLIALIVCFRELARQERVVLGAVALQFAFYIGAYLVTPHDVIWHVRWSWERLIWHLTLPLAFVMLVQLYRRIATSEQQ